MRELCGALSGAGMALGLLRGYTALEDKPAKQQHYDLIQRLCQRFQEEQGHLRCADLLEKLQGEPGPEPADRTPEYYKARPCGRLVACAARLTQELLEETA